MPRPTINWDQLYDAYLASGLSIARFYHSPLVLRPCLPVCQDTVYNHFRQLRALRETRDAAPVVELTEADLAAFSVSRRHQEHRPASSSGNSTVRVLIPGNVRRELEKVEMTGETARNISWTTP